LKLHSSGLKNYYMLACSKQISYSNIEVNNAIRNVNITRYVVMYDYERDKPVHGCTNVIMNATLLKACFFFRNLWIS
jgi:hypothetical protein